MAKRYKCPKCKTNYLSRNGSNNTGSKPRWVCESRKGGVKIYCYSTTDPEAPYRRQDGKPVDEPPPKPIKHRVPLSGVKHMVITWAQNATPVHVPFLNALRAYCKKNDAQLVVITGRYKNPTSQWTQSQASAEVWDDALSPFLQNQRKKLNANIVLAADVKTQPTAVSPTTGFEGLTGGESCVLGHPKVQMRTIATPQNKTPKILTTTGAVTLPNYTDSRAGKLGEFHHTFGAVIVELGASVFHMRHISAREDGAFIDLDRAYYPDGSTRKAPRYKAVIFGDAHYRFADPKVVRATFEKGGLVDMLDPETLIWHDLLDSYSITHHHKYNPIIQLAKHKAGLNDARREVEDTIKWMRRCSKGRKAVVVASNHDDMLSRWILSANWKDDPTNAEFYLETALHMAKSARIEAAGAAYVDPFQFWVDRRATAADDILCLRRGQSFMVGGFDCSLHGDMGPNGVRGTIRNMSRLGVKTFTGHGHSPGIEEGHRRVGTMTYLRLEYTRGPGGWLNTHGAIDAFDKAHLYNIVNGEFTYG